MRYQWKIIGELGHAGIPAGWASRQWKTSRLTQGRYVNIDKWAVRPPRREDIESAQGGVEKIGIDTITLIMIVNYSFE